MINPRTGGEAGRLDARLVWRKLAESACATGDPGVIFIDRVNELQPTPALGEIEATNPCGEQPLLPFESCVLGSIDLGKYAVGGAGAGQATSVDWPRLTTTVHEAVRFLDDVVEVTRYPLPQIERITRHNRKIGLGVMGLADLFVRLGVPYDAPAALELAARLAEHIEREPLFASAELPRERGAFDGFAASRWPAKLLGPKPTHCDRLPAQHPGQLSGQPGRYRYVSRDHPSNRCGCAG